MVQDFDNIPRRDIKKPKVGIVGEILVKFSPSANNGLVDLLEKDRSDLTDLELIKYPNSLSKATSRMVTLTFNFE